MTRTWTPEQERWLAARYAEGTVAETAAAFNEAFGTSKTKQAVAVKASKMGLAKPPRPRTRGPERAARPVRWSAEPEMDAWMAEHERGQPTGELSEAFARRFGFPLGRKQIDLWRASRGRQTGHRPATENGRSLPVGSERVRQGRVWVKVRPESEVPQARDCWEPKARVEWERANGRPVPEGCVVLFADRDARNFDPGNLVAVPAELTARVNADDGPAWGDRDTLEARVAYERLRSAILRAEGETPRRCGACGREFTCSAEQVRQGHTDMQTCPACVAAGRRAVGRRAAGTGVCEKCGREFERYVSRQRICPECHPPC